VSSELDLTFAKDSGDNLGSLAYQPPKDLWTLSNVPMNFLLDFLKILQHIMAAPKGFRLSTPITWVFRPRFRRVFGVDFGSILYAFPF